MPSLCPLAMRRAWLCRKYFLSLDPMHAKHASIVGQHLVALIGRAIAKPAQGQRPMTTINHPQVLSDADLEQVIGGAAGPASLAPHDPNAAALADVMATAMATAVAEARRLGAEVPGYAPALPSMPESHLPPTSVGFGYMPPGSHIDTPVSLQVPISTFFSVPTVDAPRPPDILVPSFSPLSPGPGPTMQAASPSMSYLPPVR